MKAKIRETGEIIEVEESCSYDGELGYWDSRNQDFHYPSDLDFLPEKETPVLEGWVCRDNNSLNAQVLIGDKPKRTGFGYWENESADCIFLHKDSFPSVTWQSEPKRVRIKIEEVEE